VSDRADKSERLRRGIEALPAIERVRAAAGDRALYLVGGAVRDILLGRSTSDLDFVVEGDSGDAAAIAERIAPGHVAHEQFGTASVDLDGVRIDIAMARTETYPSPGALPEVHPATLAEDLGRRDFTINAMAVALDGAGELIDPHGGEADLEAGLLRVLHERSFIDDPTRALRAARYAARFGFSLDPGTERLLRAADLGAVSRYRLDAEMGRLEAEEDAGVALELARSWGLA
jgi:tRNA nucleotidyltransferase (CCA-adding enzyme)